MESQPAIRADQLQQAMEKLRANAQAVAELARKEQETAGKLDQLRSDRDWRQKEAQRRAEEIARQAQRAAQQSPKQNGEFQQQAQTMNEAAAAFEARRQRSGAAADRAGGQGVGRSKPAVGRCRKATTCRAQQGQAVVNAEHAKEASQIARASNEMKQLGHLEKELARKLEEMNVSPAEQLKQLATGQEQMRGELKHIGQELERTKAKLADLSPQVARVIDNAPEAAKDRIPEKMRAATEEMKSNNTPQASQSARTAQQDLNRMADQLTRARRRGGWKTDGGADGGSDAAAGYAAIGPPPRSTTPATRWSRRRVSSIKARRSRASSRLPMRRSRSNRWSRQARSLSNSSWSQPCSRWRRNRQQNRRRNRLRSRRPARNRRAWTPRWAARDRALPNGRRLSCGCAAS